MKIIGNTNDAIDSPLIKYIEVRSVRFGRSELTYSQFNRIADHRTPVVFYDCDNERLQSVIDDDALSGQIPTGDRWPSPYKDKRPPAKSSNTPWILNPAVDLREYCTYACGV